MPTSAPGFFQVRIVRGGAHLIEYHSGDFHLRGKVFQAIQDGCHGIGGGTCIEDDYHGQTQQGGYSGTASFHPVVSVEQSHDTFGHTC